MLRGGVRVKLGDGTWAGDGSLHAVAGQYFNSVPLPFAYY